MFDTEELRVKDGCTGTGSGAVSRLPIKPKLASIALNSSECRVSFLKDVKIRNATKAPAQRRSAPEQEVASVSNFDNAKLGGLSKRKREGNRFVSSGKHT